MSTDGLKDPHFQKRLLIFNLAWPVVLLAWDWSHNRLGANPQEALTRTAGALTLIFLTLTLLISPFVQRYRWFWLVQHRRTLGLAAFFYGAFHLFTYFWFDRDGDFRTVPADIAKRPFILIGMIAFVLMIPLAATSTNAMIRRLGNPRWKKLHRLTYVAAILGVVHYYMIVKSDVTYPIFFAAVVGILLALRAVKLFGRR